MKKKKKKVVVHSNRLSSSSFYSKLIGLSGFYLNRLSQLTWALAPEVVASSFFFFLLQ
jgi:hypothetical protein